MEKESIKNRQAPAGLSSAQAEQSRREHGENVLTPPKRTPMWRLYLEKYNDPIIKVLLVAAAVSLALAVIENEFVEVIGIFVAIFLATTIGFYFERDAAKKFNVLTAIGEESPVKVVRDGKVQEIPRRDVVVGDVVVLGVGDEVPADGTLFEATDLQIDESALTGEPIISKYTDVRQDGATYPSNRALRSTMVMNGSGRMVVTAVGDATEIGKVARKSTEMTSVKTPLNLQLDRLAKLISKVGTGVAVAAFVIFLGHDLMTNDLWHTDNYLKMAEVVLQYFMVSVTLIVMAVPEGLPMAVTLALALNMRRMLKSNNLVRKLHACETMGAVTVICTDKTGTLTQNKMQVQEMWTAAGGEELLRDAIAVNSTAELDGDKPIGNPTEGALLLWMQRGGHDYRSLRSANKVVWQLPFSTERKYMATIAEVGGKRRVAQLVEVSRKNGKYSFSFEKLNTFIDFMLARGIEYFEMSHLFTQWGAKCAPNIYVQEDGNTIHAFGWHTPACKAEYREFLHAFLPALTKRLHTLGIADKTWFHISDEPSADTLDDYRAAKEMVSGYLSGFPIVDALSHVEYYRQGICSHPVPSTSHVHEFLKEDVPGLWTYYCCGQGVDVSNVFFAMPSARNRILGVQLYLYRIAGFLHWGYNFYHSALSLYPINPFTTTDAGGAFPSGDAFLVYPGKDGRPLESIRLMVQSEAFQDLRALTLLESRIGFEAVKELIEEGFGPITFFSYPKSPAYLLELRRKVNQRLKETNSPDQTG